MDRVDELVRELLAFRENITIDASGVGSDIINQALSRDHRVSYYVENISGSIQGGWSPKAVFRVTYHNKEVPPADIHIASGEDEVVMLMCRCIGDYKRRFAIFVPPSLSCQRAVDRFQEAHGAFYPNYMSSNVTMFSNSSRYVAMDFTIKYRIGKVMLGMMENEVDREVDRLAAQLFLPGMPEEAKAYLAHNYLAYSITYTNNESAGNLERSYLQSAYGALIRHKCVCQGYAEAFKRLMDVAGVRCDVVVGTTDSAGHDNHAWNIIRLHGDRCCYHVDPTWDSPGGGVVNFNYFGLSDSALASSRNWNRSYNVRCNPAPDAIAIARNYLRMKQAALVARGVPRAVIGL